jgi:hypothetical protein
LVADRFPQDEVDPLADDPVLMTVDAPPGWKFEPTGDNGYRSNLVDPQKRVRGTQFYKGVFYDRNASFSLKRRYNLDSKYDENALSQPREQRGGKPYVQWSVKDADGTVLWTGKWLTDEESTRLDKMTDDWKEYLYKEERDATCGLAWLREHYPDHDNVGAYW